MPKYDRELIARMLETPAVFEEASRREQARLLREAENLEADAKTVVREVPDGMVLVPREPTEAMRAAFDGVPLDMDEMLFQQRVSMGKEPGVTHVDHVLPAIHRHEFHKRYRAMLSAASGEKGVG